MAGCLFIYLPTVSLAADEISTPADSEVEVIPMSQTAPDSCAEAIVLLRKQNAQISREFRQVKRDIAFLTASVSKPGIKEVFGGIGYILGFLGIIFYFQSRKQNRPHKE
jgi:hypothetical protein